jgi:GIY-YIG catalytic domain-containing protein
LTANEVNVPKAKVSSGEYAVYALKDENGTPRYVGITKNPKDRYSRHLREARAKRTHRQCWISSMLAHGLKPSIEVLEWTDDWDQAEREWVFKFRALGYPLTNGNAGGISMDHVRGYNSADTKLPYFKKVCIRLGQARCGSKYLPSTPEKIAKYHAAKDALLKWRKTREKAGMLWFFEQEMEVFYHHGSEGVKEFREYAQSIARGESTYDSHS